MTIFEEEILQQQYLLTRTVEANADAVSDLAEEIGSGKYVAAAVVARGSSRNACEYFKYALERYTGMPVLFIEPSVTAVYGGKLALKNFLLFAVSQSGKAEDISSVVRAAKESGAKVVAVTNNPDSPLAKAADVRLLLNVGQEKAVAATKTFLAQMTVFTSLVDAVRGEKAEINSVLSKLFVTRHKLKPIAEALAKEKDLFVLGRGLSYSSATETALKFKEACYLNAAAYRVSEFQHGPFAVLDENRSVLLFVSDDETKDGCIKVAKRIRETGARLYAFVSDGVELTADYCYVLPHADAAETPLLQAVVGQLTALEISKIKGTSPDAPRNLKKITVTE